MPVMGVDGTATPFTYDKQTVFYYSHIFLNSVEIVHSKLGADDCSVLPTAGPFLLDVQHG